MKKVKKYIVLLMGALAITTASAQQDPQFTQYFDNTLYVNPAYAGSKEMLNITAIHREQWVGINGRPRSTSFSIHSPLRYRSLGVGFTAVNDMIGPTRQTMMYGDISYTLRFKNKTKLSFGIKGGLNMINIDQAAFTNGSNPVSILTSARNAINPNFGVGILYHGPKFFVGVSTPKILEQPYDKTNSSLEKRHYFAIAGYVATLSPTWKLRPTTQFKYTEGAPFSLDVSLTAIYNEKFWFGGMYRLDAAFGAFVQFLVTPQYKIGLASDFGTQALRKYNSGTFEIMMSYDFTFKNKGILSPRYF